MRVNREEREKRLRQHQPGIFTGWSLETSGASPLQSLISPRINPELLILRAAKNRVKLEL